MKKGAHENIFHVIKSMKKILKLLVAIILAIVIIGGFMFLVDCSKINSDKEPKFAVIVNEWDDGGTKEYIGLGYKIIDFNKINGYDEVKIGSWFMSVDDFMEEYKNSDTKIDDVKDEVIVPNMNVSGDVVIGDSVIGEITDNSGDIQSGDFVSGDEIKNEDVSGENIDIDNSGDTNIDENKSGDEEIVKEPEYYFNATVIGVNKNNIIVQALENEEITKSSDMFSFSLTLENNADNKEFLIGQKVRIQYDGNIRESYPAQIDVINIEIVE